MMDEAEELSRIGHGGVGASVLVGASFLLWIPGPILGLWLVGLVIPPAPLFALPWLWLVFPHQWLVRPVAQGFELVLPGGVAWAVAVGQWITVAVLYCVLTRHLSHRTRLSLIPVVIILVGIVFNILVALLGLTVQADWV